MLKDNTEIVIMFDRSCDGGGCGYTRPGGLAYRESIYSVFEQSKLTLHRRLRRRPQKRNRFKLKEDIRRKPDIGIFLMEFSMPLTGNTGFNADMPAY